MSRHTVGEFWLLVLVVSAGQFLGRWIFSQMINFPPAAIFFGYQPQPPARTAV